MTTAFVRARGANLAAAQPSLLATMVEPGVGNDLVVKASSRVPLR